MARADLAAANARWRVRARWRPLIASLGVVLAVAACTSAGEEATPPPPTPEPPPATTPAAGIRVGFVLPPAASEEDDQRTQLAGDLQLVGALRDEGISEIRSFEPDGPEFVADLAALLAERRTDLICVLGPGAQQVVAPLAIRHPQLHFCAVPAGAPEPPDNVTVVELRFEELGHLLGLAAGMVAEDGPVAALFGSDRAGVSRLRDGIRAGVGDVPLLESAPSDEDAVLAAVDEAIAAEAQVIVLDVGIAARTAVERAVAAGLRVIAPAAVLGELEVQETTVLSWRLRWDVALRPVVASVLDPEVEAPTSIGFADNVFLVTLGDALTGTPREVVESAASELRRGVRDPLEAPAGLPEADVDGEDDAGDGPDDGAASQGEDDDA
jgi:basic membrane lipoprotein Med (substrate-binding protein (PBP1-ABC) superfamily)